MQIKVLLARLLCLVFGLAVWAIPVDAESTASEALAFDNAAWRYDAENDVYWQIGVVYCECPADTNYESLGIYVPGAYLDGADNGDGTYTCAIDADATINGYTALTAPVVLPVNTAGYSAQAAPAAYDYSGPKSYLEAGFVYVHAGCRGRANLYGEDGALLADGGAPWGVTDLKAAVRYLRYNAQLLPGDEERIFTFGHSGGGAQSAVMGASGDSELYEPYLLSIGAAMTDASGAAISDAVCGAMAWCPITSLDSADAAYEWMMGQYSDQGARAADTWTGALSDDLAAAYADTINRLGLCADGEVLTLEPSAEGIYAAGTYYDYLLGVIEDSLADFLRETEFPYASGGGLARGENFEGGGERALPADANFEMHSGERPGALNGDGASGSGGALNGEAPAGQELAAGGEAVVYQSAREYVDALNADKIWIEYDEQSGAVSLSGIEAFVTHCKSASKDLGAFDDLRRAQAENDLFGTAQSDAAHFDALLTELLRENAERYAQYADWDESLVDAYQGDLLLLDSVGCDIVTRQNMYNPMYYLCQSEAGATPAAHWRIRTGIEQSDTALTVEVNLALALEACEAVADVDFATVWGQGHTAAELTGNSTDNFIAWVDACYA